MVVMKRRSAVLLLCCAIVFAAMLAMWASAAVASAMPAPAAVKATPTASTVLVNGKSVAFEAYNINDNNYFKLRDLAYTLNGSEKQFAVGWDESANAIALTSGKPYESVGGEMGSKGAGAKDAVPTDASLALDGKPVDVTAYNIADNNYYKLRDIGAALDFAVDWSEERNTILIDTSRSYSEDESTSAGASAGGTSAPSPTVDDNDSDNNDSDNNNGNDNDSDSNNANGNGNGNTNDYDAILTGDLSSFEGQYSNDDLEKQIRDSGFTLYGYAPEDYYTNSTTVFPVLGKNEFWAGAIRASYTVNTEKAPQKTGGYYAVFFVGANVVAIPGQEFVLFLVPENVEGPDGRASDEKRIFYGPDANSAVFKPYRDGWWER